MKRSLRIACAPAALALLPLALGAVAWAADLLTVTERETVMRKDKKAWSPKVGELKEGDKVALVEKAEPWMRVEFEGVQGWINQASVTDNPNVVLSKDAAARGARATMASSAGRNFDDEIEKEYRKDKPNLKPFYEFLDRLEDQSSRDDEVLSFVKSGRLIESLEGGAN